MGRKRFKIIYLEITNACNFTCDYCPIDRQTRLKEVMPTDFACRIMDQIADHDLTDTITFHVMGEPYLHKDVAKLVAYAEGRGLHVRLLTNGSLLESKRNRALFAAGLTRLEVGFRTPTESAFNMRLRGGSLTLDDYIERTNRLIDDKLETGAATDVCIKLFIRSHAAALKMADSYEHLTSEEDNKRVARIFQQRALDTARRLGLPTQEWEARPIITRDGEYPIFPGIHLGFSRIQDFWVREQRGENNGRAQHKEPVVVPLGGQALDHGVLGQGQASAGGNGRDDAHRYYPACVGGCSAGFRDDFGILVSGEVTTCCVDYDGRNVIGDLRKQSLMEVLESAEARRIQRSLAWFRPPTEFCKECLGGPTLATSLIKQVSTAIMDAKDRLRPRVHHRPLLAPQRHNDLT